LSAVGLAEGAVVLLFALLVFAFALLLSYVAAAVLLACDE